MDGHREFLAAMLPLLIAIVLLWGLLGWMRFHLRSGRERGAEPETTEIDDEKA